MNRTWEDFSVKENLLINQSYFHFLKCYLKQKEFSPKDRVFSYIHDKNTTINIDVFGGYIRIIFSTIYENKKIYIWLHRYVLYPEILDVETSVSVPYPDWGYGYIEQMISTLELSILDDLVFKKNKFNSILADQERFYHNFLSKPYIVRTKNTVSEEDNKMLKIHFEPTYLSLELYKNGKNPFIKQHNVNSFKR
jgi:hypothetical protein